MKSTLSNPNIKSQPQPLPILIPIITRHSTPAVNTVNTHSHNDDRHHSLQQPRFFQASYTVVVVTIVTPDEANDRLTSPDTIVATLAAPVQLRKHLAKGCFTSNLAAVTASV